ncbi:MAG: DUF5309 family protein [Sedimentisphaeraceae bacterium JB056]
MSFTGKATYSSGASLPSIAEDVSDIIGIVSPYETPLLDAIGDPLRNATSTYHEWLEDGLLPNRDQIVTTVWDDPADDSLFNVANSSRFRVGDQIQVEGSKELMLVTGIGSGSLTVVRGYGATTKESLYDDATLNIIGGAALEGEDKPENRFTIRQRKGNYTQIFTAAVEVSGSDLAANQIGLADEMDYQKQERLRELIRDLENTVINGGMAVSNPEGSSTTRRTMNGIIQSCQSNLFTAGDSGLPSGTVLNEELVNFMLKRIWENSNSGVDTIVVGGAQKRKINTFLSGSRVYSPDDTAYRSLVDLYESDFGLCRIILTRWMPADSVLFLDSSRLSVLPLAGRSFHFKPLASTGDYDSGEIIGEYTLEMKNEQAHGLLRGLSV